MVEVRGFVEVRACAVGFEWRAGFHVDGVDFVLVSGDASSHAEAVDVGLEALRVLGEAAGVRRDEQSVRVVNPAGSEVWQ